MSIDIQVGWQASRFDRKAKALGRALRRAADAGDSVIGTDECAAPHRRKQVRAPGYRTLQKVDGPMGMAECAILVQVGVWDILHWESRQLGPDLGPGDIVNGIAAALRHKETGLVVVFGFAHLPASVEGDFARRVARVNAYIRAAVQQRKFMREIRDEYDADAAIVINDWNLNALKTWVQAWLKTAFPGYRYPKFMKDRTFPGTHAGGRLIDFPLLWGSAKLLDFDVLPEDPHSDHRGTRSRVRIWRRKKSRRAR